MIEVSTRAVAVERGGVGSVLADVPAHGVRRRAGDQRGRGSGRTADALRRPVEEIVGGDDGGGRDQRGVGERLDRVRQRRLQIGRRWRLASTPIVNSFGPGVAEVVAVSLMTSLDPIGKVEAELDGLAGIGQRR